MLMPDEKEKNLFGIWIDESRVPHENSHSHGRVTIRYWGLHVIQDGRRPKLKSEEEKMSKIKVKTWHTTWQNTWFNLRDFGVSNFYKMDKKFYQFR